MRILIYILFFSISLNAQLSPKDFDSIESWAKWIDIKGNYGVIDTDYDFNYAQLSFKNKLILIGNGTIKNTFPIKLNKGLDIENITFINSKKWSQYGYVFYGYNLDSVNVRLVNVKSSYNMAFLYMTANQASVYIDSNLHEHNEKSVIAVTAKINGLVYKNNIVRNSLPTKRFSGVRLGNSDSKNAIVYNNKFENIKANNYDNLFYNLLIEGDSTQLIKNDFKECQVAYYIRGNNAIEYKNTVYNDSVIASIMFINKGAKTKGNTVRFENKYIGKANLVGLFDGIDNQFNYKNTFSITPTDITVKGVFRRSKSGLREANTFRSSKGTEFYFIDNEVQMYGKNNFDFINLRMQDKENAFIQSNIKTYIRNWKK